MPGPKRKTPFEVIIGNLQIGSGCWLWQGNLDKHSYGRIFNGRNSTPYYLWAHREVYGMFVGPIPEGMEIDHLCRNPQCVRPDHLEAVTHAENIRRSAVTKMWTHCSKGHPLAGSNLKPASKGRFRCRQCANSKPCPPKPVEVSA